MIVVWDGLVDLAQWQAHVPRMLSDPQYVPAAAQLTDLRFSSIDESIGEDDIRRMTDYFATQHSKLEGKRLAIVAGGEWEKPKQVELSLKSQMVQTIVFNDLVTACVWLGTDVVEAGREIQQLRLKLRRSPWEQALGS